MDEHEQAICEGADRLLFFMKYFLTILFLFFLSTPVLAYSRTPSDAKVYSDLTFDFVAIDFCDQGENWKFSLYNPTSGIAYLFVARATTSAIATLSCGDSYCTNGIGCDDFVCPWNLIDYTVQAICTTDAVGVVSSQYEASSQQNPDDFIIYDSSDLCSGGTCNFEFSDKNIAVISAISSSTTGTTQYFIPAILYFVFCVFVIVFSVGIIFMIFIIKKNNDD